MTELKTNRYYRKPFAVDAVQVTEENLHSIAVWCDGNIVPEFKANGEERLYVKVPVLMPLTERQEKAYVGDWVLKSETGWKVYTDRAFHKSFALQYIHVTGNELPPFTGLMTDEELANAVIVEPKDTPVSWSEGQKAIYGAYVHGDPITDEQYAAIIERPIPDDVLEMVDVVDVMGVINDEINGAIVNQFNKDFNETVGAYVLPVIDTAQLREMTAGAWEPPKLETVQSTGTEHFYEGYQFLITEGDARVPHFILTWAEQNNGGWFDINDTSKILPQQGVSIDAGNGAMVVVNNGLPYEVRENDWVLRNKASGKFFVIGNEHFVDGSYAVV